MGDEAPQFDALLGGNETLPKVLGLEKFIAHRAQELHLMKKSISSPSASTKLAFQTLPKHMRRRTMSHNVKRLPRRLRQIHLNQMRKSGMPIQNKRPSRKFRRRPKNISVEYTHRMQRGPKWLQTHIWHAKRFHMVAKWGYKIACHPRDKCFRANYRAFTQRCLLQDVSYLKCVEVGGDRAAILKQFAKLHKKNTGLTLAAKAFASGSREGSIFVYRTETMPIGAINYEWRPDSCQNGGHTALFLWIHPAIYDSILKLLNHCFSDEKNVTLTENMDDFARLRLTGPLSTAILFDTLKLLDASELDKLEQNGGEICGRKVDLSAKNRIKAQNERWNGLKNLNAASYVSPHSILSLMVQDPRYNLPKKRRKVVPDYENQSEFDFEVSYAPELSDSWLWEPEVRRKCNDNIISNAKIAELRSNLLVPGSDFTEGLIYLPILLIRRPGNKRNNAGLGSGWDLILPAKWAKPFWVSFVMRGARVGGLRESNMIRFEMGQTSALEPDTLAGEVNEKAESEAKMTKFFNLPPNKRTNYNKFRIVSPFACAWGLLVHEWSEKSVEIDGFRVLRDRFLLAEISDFLLGKSRQFPACPPCFLVPVHLIMEGNGAPKPYAVICVVGRNDGKNNAIFEPICGDGNEEKRKIMRKSHAKLLKRLRRRRKLKKEEDKDDLATVANYTKEMRRLWLPEVEGIRYSCAREVCGFVQNGGLGLTVGRGAAVGYVAAAALPFFTTKNRVLVRNTNSRLYKMAAISVILE